GGGAVPLAATDPAWVGRPGAAAVVGWSRSARSPAVSPDPARGAIPLGVRRGRCRRLLGDPPDASVARRPVGPTFHVLAPGDDLRDVHGRVIGKIRAPELLELSVDLRSILRLDG